MKIQRYSLPSGSTTQPSDSGFSGKIHDAEADKAAALAALMASETSLAKVNRRLVDELRELRQELVALLERDFRSMGDYAGENLVKALLDSHAMHIGERLVDLGVWEQQKGGWPNYQFYRPIEHQDSGESDE